MIKGSYNPVPSTRSKELRDLISRMLTLDWNKRPSINDLLALPVCKARIEKFLSSTLKVRLDWKRRGERRGRGRAEGMRCGM